MTAGTILMPGGLRLRSLYPLPSQDGTCSLLYDIERNALVEVPEEYAYHVAYALDNGDLDENLLGWLASEDLLTYERSAAWEPSAGRPAPSLSALGFDPSAEQGLECVYFLHNRAHCRIDGGGGAAVEALEQLLERLDGVPRVAVHLDGRESSFGLDALRRMEALARERERATGQEIRFELTLDAAAVSPGTAEFLRGSSFRVRLAQRGTGPPADGAAGLARLLGEIPERVTLHAVLGEGERLADLWSDARQRGLRSLHVTKVATEGDDPLTHEAELRAFREDLTRVCDAMLAAVEAGRTPLTYEPVLRVVRHLMGQGFSVAGAGRPAYMGVISKGRVFPLFGQPAHPTACLEPAEGGVEAGSAGCGTACGDCWARRLCGHGLAGDPVQPGSAGTGSCSRHCDFWRAEVEAGILFYRRLLAIDPDSCLGLAGEEVDAFADGLEAFQPAGELFELQVC